MAAAAQLVKRKPLKLRQRLVRGRLQHMVDQMERYQLRSKNLVDLHYYVQIVEELKVCIEDLR